MHDHWTYYPPIFRISDTFLLKNRTRKCIPDTEIKLRYRHMPRYRPKIVWSPTLGDSQYQTNSYDAVKDLGRPLSKSPIYTTKAEQGRLARAIMRATIVKAFPLLFPRRGRWRENPGPLAMGFSSALRPRSHACSLFHPKRHLRPLGIPELTSCQDRRTHAAIIWRCKSQSLEKQRLRRWPPWGYVSFPLTLVESANSPSSLPLPKSCGTSVNAYLSASSTF